jgi:DNA mismatch repair ATPase MutS
MPGTFAPQCLFLELPHSWHAFTFLCLQVLFKYLLSSGPCPKSYGPSVALAAGIPRSVAERAVEVSESLEQRSLPMNRRSLDLFQKLWGHADGGGKNDLAALRHLLKELGSSIEC